MVVRHLILDDDDLIMVVQKDVVRQIDENRGEMSRTEFVNFLIHHQLKESNRSINYTTKEELYHVLQEIKELLTNFIDFILALELTNQASVSSFQEFINKVQILGSSENE